MPVDGFARLCSMRPGVVAPVIARRCRVRFRRGQVTCPAARRGSDEAGGRLLRRPAIAREPSVRLRGGVCLGGCGHFTLKGADRGGFERRSMRGLLSSSAGSRAGHSRWTSGHVARDWGSDGSAPFRRRAGHRFSRRRLADRGRVLRSGHGDGHLRIGCCQRSIGRIGGDRRCRPRLGIRNDERVGAGDHDGDDGRADPPGFPAECVRREWIEYGTKHLYRARCECAGLGLG